MNPEPDDYELARRARDGDREALAALIERTRLSLFALAYAELRHYQDAQDAVAGALYQICRHVGELREPARVRAWMNSIVRNEAHRLRRSPDAAWMSLEDVDPPAPEAAPSVLRLDIERALRRLPRDQARALALFYLARLPIREIARRVERPEGTIKLWLHLGRRRLAQEMKDYAPMAPAPTVTIIQTDLDPTLLQQLTDALRVAGFGTVATLTALPGLVETGQGGTREFHLPDSLKGTRLLLLDEWIGGRSAFELFTVLKVAAEAKNLTICMLASSPTESTAFAAWAAGVDGFFAKEGLVDAGFENCMKSIAASSRGCS